jgi:hypothetical protein
MEVALLMGNVFEEGENIIGNVLKRDNFKRGENHLFDLYN